MIRSGHRDGGCLCGGVRYRIHGEARPVLFCHCEQCRRTSGHHVAATSCPKDRLELLEEGTLRWYASSAIADRGFCATCGGNLFWRPVEGGDISIMAGTLDRPTGLTGSAHIYVADKSDYYTIADGLPQQAGWDDQPTEPTAG